MSGHLKVRPGALYVVEAGDPGERGPTLWCFEVPDHFQLEPGDVLLALQGHDRGGLLLHSRTGLIGWIAAPRMAPSSSSPGRTWLREVRR